MLMTMKEKRIYSSVNKSGDTKRMNFPTLFTAMNLIPSGMMELCRNVYRWGMLYVGTFVDDFSNFVSVKTFLVLCEHTA